MPRPEWPPLFYPAVALAGSASLACALWLYAAHAACEAAADVPTPILPHHAVKAQSSSQQPQQHAGAATSDSHAQHRERTSSDTRCDAAATAHDSDQSSIVAQQPPTPTAVAVADSSAAQEVPAVLLAQQPDVQQEAAGDAGRPQLVGEQEEQPQEVQQQQPQEQQPREEHQQEQEQEQEQEAASPLPTPPQSPRLAQAETLPLQQHPHISGTSTASAVLQPPPARPTPRQQQQQEWPPLQRRLSLDVEPAAGADAPHHRSFNTSRRAPSLEATVANASVARSLQAQYAVGGSSSSSTAATATHSAAAALKGRAGSAGGGGSSSDVPQQRSDQQVLASLAASCAALCVQHCAKLLQHGETTVLDIGCGTGGCCFELATSFSHVLGIDGDLLNITAAKELKAQGELWFTPPATAAGAATSEPQQQQVVRVPDHIDRDRVRFWHCPLPQLPPKLQPVDAVLVEDVEGSLGSSGLRSVCQQLPELLSPEAVCVVVVGGIDSRQAAASLSGVRSWLADSGLVFVRELQVPFTRSAGGGGGGGGGELQHAYAGVWLQRP